MFHLIIHTDDILSSQYLHLFEQRCSHMFQVFSAPHTEKHTLQKKSEINMGQQKVLLGQVEDQLVAVEATTRQSAKVGLHAYKAL